MAGNRYDQATRYLIKLDPLGFQFWLFDTPASPARFLRWLDARSIPFPGEPDRVCDTVAALDDGRDRWALPIEVQLKPDAAMFGRLLQYLGRLWCEKRPDVRQRYA